MTEDDGVTFRQYSYDDLNQLKSELFYDKASRIPPATLQARDTAAAPTGRS